jgi:hypothetical protein
MPLNPGARLGERAADNADRREQLDQTIDEPRIDGGA